jgi:hypothetical protein
MISSKRVNHNTFPLLAALTLLILCYPTYALAHGEQIFPFLISWGIISIVMTCLMLFIKIALHIRILMILVYVLSTFILFLMPMGSLFTETAWRSYERLFLNYPAIAPIFHVVLASIPPLLIYLIAKARQTATEASQSVGRVEQPRNPTQRPSP